MIGAALHDRLVADELLRVEAAWLVARDGSFEVRKEARHKLEAAEALMTALLQLRLREWALGREETPS